VRSHSQFFGTVFAQTFFSRFLKLLCFYPFPSFFVPLEGASSSKFPPIPILWSAIPFPSYVTLHRSLYKENAAHKLALGSVTVSLRVHVAGVSPPCYGSSTFSEVFHFSPFLISITLLKFFSPFDNDRFTISFLPGTGVWWSLFLSIYFLRKVCRLSVSRPTAQNSNNDSLRSHPFFQEAVLPWFSSFFLPSNFARRNFSDRPILSLSSRFVFSPSLLPPFLHS